MTTQIARNDCPVVQQVTTLTPTADNLKVYDVLINTKSPGSYTSDGSGLATEISAGLQAVLAAADATQYPEFDEVTWTDGVGTIVATGPDTGKPFTVTDGPGNGLWTSITLTTTPKGPNHWIAENFSGAALPANGDTVILSGLTEAQSFYYSLDQNGVQPAVLDIRADSEARIGLPTLDEDGSYYQYRETHLLIDPSVLKIGDGIGNGARQIKIKLTGAVGCDVTVYQTATNPLDQDEAPVQLAGGNAANTLQLLSGAVDIAMLPGYTATYATLTVSGGVLRCGSGLTVATVDVAGGRAETRSAVTTLSIRGEGKATHIGAANIGTADVNGTLEIQATGALTITQLNLYGGKTLDLSKCDAAVTVTDMDVYATPNNPAVIRDPNNKLVMTNAASCPNGVQSLSILSGSGKNIRIS